jgi:hypothetical protein
VSEHSPGPWQPDTDAVADVHGNRVCLRPVAARDEEWEAHARLIAAAPELLAALRAAASAEIVWHARQKSWRALIARIEGR